MSEELHDTREKLVASIWPEIANGSQAPRGWAEACAQHKVKRWEDFIRAIIKDELAKIPTSPSKEKSE